MVIHYWSPNTIDGDHLSNTINASSIRFWQRSYLIDAPRVTYQMNVDRNYTTLGEKVVAVVGLLFGALIVVALVMISASTILNLT